MNPPADKLLYRKEGSTFVRMKGLEPPRLTAPDPKSGAAANYATSANSLFKLNKQVFLTNGVQI